MRLPSFTFHCAVARVTSIPFDSRSSTMSNVYSGPISRISRWGSRSSVEIACAAFVCRANRFNEFVMTRRQRFYECFLAYKSGHGNCDVKIPLVGEGEYILLIYRGLWCRRDILEGCIYRRSGYDGVDCFGEGNVCGPFLKFAFTLHIRNRDLYADE